jgi:hypothetical protein
VEQTRRNAPFIVATPCQSEIKRTLRRINSQPNTVASRAFEHRQAAQSTQMVNAGFPALIRYGFEMVDAACAATSCINRKFTPNQIIRIFGKFSKI